MNTLLIITNIILIIYLIISLIYDHIKFNNIEKDMEESINRLHRQLAYSLNSTIKPSTIKEGQRFLINSLDCYNSKGYDSLRSGQVLIIEVINRKFIADNTTGFGVKGGTVKFMMINTTRRELGGTFEANINVFKNNAEEIEVEIK